MGSENIIFSAYLIGDLTLTQSIQVILYFKDTGKFFEFMMRLSHEFVQELRYRGEETDILLDMISNFPENYREISIEYLQSIIEDPSNRIREDLKKVIIPYIRQEKLNKLI
jgi:hypothetical protein